MSDWTGGFGHDTRPANAKIPVKVHRNLCVVRTADPLLSNELLARPKLCRLVIGRLTDEVLLIQPGKADEVLEELRKMGHSPQIVGGR